MTYRNRKSQFGAIYAEMILLITLMVLVAAPAMSGLAFKTNQMFCSMHSNDDPALGRDYYSYGPDGKAHCWKNPSRRGPSPILYYF